MRLPREVGEKNVSSIKGGVLAICGATGGAHAILSCFRNKPEPRHCRRITVQCTPYVFCMA